MMHSILVLCLSICLPVAVYCWPSGAPDSVCDTLTPRHGQNQAKSTASPFTVSQSQSSYEPGDRVKVVIQAPRGSSFKGLMVQAVDFNTNQPIGLFEAGRGLKVIDSCSSVTHSDRRGKRAATLVWDAPKDTNGKVAFRATIVQRFSEFWTGLESDVNPDI